METTLRWTSADLERLPENGKRYEIIERTLIREIEIYRRKNKRLRFIETLHSSDTLASPLLPGFSCQVREIFEDYLANRNATTINQRRK